MNNLRISLKEQAEKIADYIAKKFSPAYNQHHESLKSKEDVLKVKQRCIDVLEYDLKALQNEKFLVEISSGRQREDYEKKIMLLSEEKAKALEHSRKTIETAAKTASLSDELQRTYKEFVSYVLARNISKITKKDLGRLRASGLDLSVLDSYGDIIKEYNHLKEENLDIKTASVTFTSALLLENNPKFKHAPIAVYSQNGAKYFESSRFKILRKKIHEELETVFLDSNAREKMAKRRKFRRRVGDYKIYFTPLEVNTPYETRNKRPVVLISMLREHSRTKRRMYYRTIRSITNEAIDNVKERLSYLEEIIYAQEKERQNQQKLALC
ncbi:MAG: hypothetical protein AABX73_04570 [Nanoarchaeota archaeon]